MLNNLLIAAAAAGYTFIVRCDGEIDYRGANRLDALDAIQAVDEAEVSFVAEGMKRGWALIVNSLDEDEQIADCSGWVSLWMDEEG